MIYIYIFYNNDNLRFLVCKNKYNMNQKWKLILYSFGLMI